MKKKLLLLAITAICVSILAGGSLAYNTAEQQVHNVITSNAVDIEIEEWQERIENIPAGGGSTDDGLSGGGEFIPTPTWTAYPSKESIAVMPSVTVSKIATVKNNDAEAYIRAKYEVTIKDKDGKPFKKDDKELSEDIKKSLVSLSNEGITAGTKLPQGVTIQAGQWLSKDGDSEWLYYSVPVPTGKSTAPLFTKVTFSGVNIGNEYQNCTIEVNIFAQGVQSANQNVTDVKDVKGWPATAPEQPQ